MLQEIGLTQNIDLLLQFYEQQQETIVLYLNQMGISFPQLIGLDWRLDYAIRSKSTGKENIPMYHLSFKVLVTKNNSNNNNQFPTSNQTSEDHINNHNNHNHNDSQQMIHEINCLASLEECQDLLAKVKDAMKQVDRLLLSSEH